MPIFVRQLDSPPPPVRSGDDVAVGPPALPGGLRPPGGVFAPAPAPAPHRALALDALVVVRSLRDHPRDAGPWGEPAFAREVERIRHDLSPIVSRRGLAASFGREACHTRSTDRPDREGVLDPLRVAYALRWLELGDGDARPGWTRLVTGRD